MIVSILLSYELIGHLTGRTKNREYMGNKATSVANTLNTAQKVTTAMKPKCIHVKARCETYPRSQQKRFYVPDHKVSWDVDFPEYDPVNYTSESILKRPVYADPDIRTETVDTPLKFNKCDGRINRVSHDGEYSVIDGLPRNPSGRTGVIGRGCLGRWGPNHAADPIVTRWKRDDQGSQVQGADGKFILQFVCVQRRDNNQWAIPGGMVDAGEVITATLRREFSEEALNSLEMNPMEKNRVEKELEELFSNGVEVYRGYVDDPRNTDNAWMETVALNFHDEDSSCFGNIHLCAGDDAQNVKWMDLSGSLDLYASHKDFLLKVAQLHNADW